MSHVLSSRRPAGGTMHASQGFSLRPRQPTALSAAVLDRPAVAAPASVAAKVNYTQRVAKGEQLYNYVEQKPDHLPHHTNLERDLQDVQIQNLGHAEHQGFKPTLEANGFTVASFKIPEGIDWKDDKSVEALYWPALEQLLKRETGGSRVHVFDHTKRKGNIRDGTESEEDMQRYDQENRRPPVSLVHVDYTTVSGIERMRALLPAEEVERLQKTPFAVVQVWRPTRGPVDSSPLAMIDAASVAKEDLMPYAIHFPGRTGWNYALAHNPGHQWYYKKGLEEDEAYVFVCYDSRAGRARFTPHTGFKDPSSSPDAFERESVEARAYVFFESEPPAEPEIDLDPSDTFHQPNFHHENSGNSKIEV